MDWRRLLLIATLIASTAASTVASSQCSSGSQSIFGCINGGGVDVTGTVNTPGSGGGGGGGNGNSGNGGGGTDGPPIIWKCMEVTCGDDTEDPGTRGVTLSDIAHFRPTPGVQYMQPDGWAVPGLHTNFYAVTGVHTVTGSLLGRPAAVRFTPVAYHWDYGDGTRATRSTKGGTWKSLGLREFDRTPTSHVYLREGRYTIRLTIDFAPAYRYDGGTWVPIPGVIPLPANELRTVVDGAKTVLVERHCAVDPRGPGC